MKYCIIYFLLLFLSCTGKITSVSNESKQLSFAAPQHVTVQGYTGHLMEPFISRDGHWLFFNNLNGPTENTNIYYAERINDTLFNYAGEVRGLNTVYLEGVATMDRDLNFYCISNRTYQQDFSTVYRAVFTNGIISAPVIVPGISLSQPGIVDFDAEISADGQTMYFAEGRFNQTGQPQTADIILATRSANGFVRLPASETILQHINTSELEYAAGISPDELTLYFTRLPAATPGVTARLYYATRDNKAAVFDIPRLITGISGFTEAVSISGDSLLYFHRRDAAAFQLYCMKKQ